MKTYSRRQLLEIGVTRFGLMAAAAPWILAFDSNRLWAGDFAQGLVRTPPQTEGPFYPTTIPLDADNDLVVVDDSITPAVGEIAHLSGRILDAAGRPVRNALVEIWQVDSTGAYHHAGSDGHAGRDRHFQGFGRFETGSTGEYTFRTIKPVPYPGRTPHVHFKVKRGGQDALTTQCYIKGEPRNANDGVLRGIRDQQQRDSVIVDFVPVPDSPVGGFVAMFDIVLGRTPALD